ncbi:CidB/LrgB family autolysis modulator [Bacillus badius]|uniref:CidA-associated membrane protein CidB n=1 Tax=Bacillus badius TaxID=1455 RepID=A0ABR5AUB2_BACBA|nr:CidB/LrgB family autolysis modulator [Bacillus badius]KIL76726.1 CidA-associated membrane protein CidB [Bacillus badius]KIL78341.1 CidA-associated membrane protein CidB [Bacillus badius]KZR57727.1 CidB/LrgB family autolysis modulator [Bacillus badius]MED4715866.1 CidB/LrgB family autolysis modulator [Bacillus badius]
MTALFSLVFTISLYWGAKWCYKHKPKVYLSPLLTVPVLVGGCLLLTGISYESYDAGAQWLSRMLEPATIAFAVPLYKYFNILKKHAAEIFISVFSGSIAAILSSMAIAKMLHLNPQIVESLIPRSVTTPIAMGVSETIGGIPAITAVFVIMTGLLGSIIGPIIIHLLRIDNDIARGVLLGTGAHGAGTSKAFEFSSITGTISSLSMILAALITLFTVPWILSVLPILL